MEGCVALRGLPLTHGTALLVQLVARFGPAFHLWQPQDESAPPRTDVAPGAAGALTALNAALLRGKGTDEEVSGARVRARASCMRARNMVSSLTGVGCFVLCAQPCLCLFAVP